jgi:hypothetical protein
VARLTQRQFRRYIDRDQSAYESGRDDATMVPQHRVNRGSGGSAAREQPSNVLCIGSLYNNLIESDAEQAAIARRRGIKLESWMDPLKVPAFHVSRGWVMLDDSYGITTAPEETVSEWIRDPRLARWGYGA